MCQIICITTLSTEDNAYGYSAAPENEINIEKIYIHILYDISK